MAGPSRRRTLGLAIGAAVLVGLVLVTAVGESGPFDSDVDHGADDQHGSDSPLVGRSDRSTGAGARIGSNADDQQPSTPPGTSGPPVTSPGGGGDEGESEWGVWVVSARGGRPRLSARTPSEVPVTPAWSARTGLIAFVQPSCEDCDAAVWMTRADGAGRRKLRTGLGDMTDPAWSPSGRALAAVRVGGGLYAVSTREGGSRPLLGMAVVEDPAWSPRGESITFARREGAAGWDLYAIRPRGRALRRLTRSRAQEVSPDWSPNGRRIAFQRQERSGAWSVYTMRADGSGVRRLIAGASAHNAEQPAWSPDGRSIAFVAVTLRGSRVEIFRVGAGRPPQPITGPALQVADPDWSPDGQRIVFSGKRAEG
jgi:Tol biopolymer transport system component